MTDTIGIDKVSGSLRRIKKSTTASTYRVDVDWSGIIAVPSSDLISSGIINYAQGDNSSLIYPEFDIISESGENVTSRVSLRGWYSDLYRAEGLSPGVYYLKISAPSGAQGPPGPKGDPGEFTEEDLDYVVDELKDFVIHSRW